MFELVFDVSDFFKDGVVVLPDGLNEGINLDVL